MTRIALVEDNPDNRMLASAILEELYDIDEYETGMDALAAFERAVPVLVLLDISLPHMDGTEVLRRMRADERLSAVPVIALTAHAMAGDRDRYMDMGFDAYVSKPIVDEQLLLGEIERLLKRDAS
ncbi:MAG TPA: response regulator [Longimicrobiales bacterium]|nr:response regulator [Longimicrobiales bacterium]